LYAGGCGQFKHESEVSFLLPGRLYDHTSQQYIPVKVPAELVIDSKANADYRCSFRGVQNVPVLDVCCDATESTHALQLCREFQRNACFWVVAGEVVKQYCNTFSQ